MTNTNLNSKLIESIVDNFNSITNNNYQFDFIQIQLDNFISKILIYKNNNSNKKFFSRFINYNYKLIENNFDFDLEILKTFEDSTNENWNLLHICIVSYLTYLKNTINDPNINYKGMINKIMNKIEERTEDLSSESSVEDNDLIKSNPINSNLIDMLKSNLPTSNNSPFLMKGLLTDIKSMINNNDTSNPKNILNMSKDISTKYQELIENGNVNINDLLGGVLGLISDPSIINDEFKDINTNNLPDPNLLLGEIKDDPNLKKTFENIGSDSNMNILGSLMSNFMNDNKKEDSKSIQELEKDIERMMLEVQEYDNNLNN